MRFDETVASHVLKMVKEVKLQIKTHFIEQCDQALIISFLAIIKLVLDTSRLLESAAMRLLSFFVKTALATTLNSRMSAATDIAPESHW